MRTGLPSNSMTPAAVSELPLTPDASDLPDAIAMPTTPMTNAITPITNVMTHHPSPLRSPSIENSFIESDYSQ